MNLVTLGVNCLRSGMVFLPILLGAPATAAGVEPHHETTYVPLKNNTEIQWSSCGDTIAGSGCDAGGTFTGFKRACALLEGDPTVAFDTLNKTRHTVTRNIYVVDGGSVATDPVVLKVYKRTDLVAIPDVILTGSSVLINTIPLPLKSGPGVSCSMAANKHALFIGTTLSTIAVHVSKVNYAKQLLRTGSTTPIQSIQADANGYIVVTHTTVNPDIGTFDIFGPSLTGLHSGGGAGFIVDARNGYSLSNMEVVSGIRH